MFCVLSLFAVVLIIHLKREKRGEKGGDASVWLRMVPLPATGWRVVVERGVLF